MSSENVERIYMYVETTWAGISEHLRDAKKKCNLH
jgi:hypothetical protein